MSEFETLTELVAGAPLLVGGDRVVRISKEIAKRFRPGDTLAAIERTGELLLIPAAQRRIAEDAVSRACKAFVQMSQVTDLQIAKFYGAFAARLEDPAIWRQVLEKNQADVEEARRRGRSTTRLVASDKLRQGMIEGLRGWTKTSSKRGQVLERVEHDGWVAELIGAELGVIAFVFEGRPNVLADATGVLRGGNTVVFRIGRDALGTARALMQLALEPALKEAGLPEGACVLVDSSEHAAGWSLFMDRRLSLAVARGSGPAVATLGSLAQKAGVPVSLHGTGGAWICTGKNADPDSLKRAIFDSLDRKVCNTINTCCILEEHAAALVPAFLAALESAGKRRNQSFKLHATATAQKHLPSAMFSTRVKVRRAEGDVDEAQAELLADEDLGVEWEWEDTPEVSLTIVKNVDEAVGLFNRHSPQFVASLISSDADEQDGFYRSVNAPFVGDGFTRWVDGQYALNRPELGLSNWQSGRLFARGGILTGDGVFTVRTRMRHTQ
jgi:glutamate-5-semialdehyde dehydrogenase